jgi:hypothetical protein
MREVWKRSVVFLNGAYDGADGVSAICGVRYVRGEDEGEEESNPQPLPFREGEHAEQGRCVMPAYNFQKQFVPMILDGSKHHTIRRRRKRATIVGDMLMLYTGMRTKQCLLIAVTECVKIEPVMILPFRMEMSYVRGYNVQPLNVEEINQLAKADGFEDTHDFFYFFRRYKLEVLDDFEIIHWNVKDMIVQGSGEHKSGVIRLTLGGA